MKLQIRYTRLMPCNCIVCTEDQSEWWLVPIVYNGWHFRTVLPMGYALPTEVAPNYLRFGLGIPK
jgi:hypothetical protein